MTNYMVLDFEVQEEDMDKLGPAWPWGGAEVICYAFKVNCNPIESGISFDKLKEKLDKTNVLIAHNAQYECGLLTMLGYDIHRKDLMIVDTEMLARLYDNTLEGYSLDDLAKQFLNEEKSLAKLDILAEEMGRRKLIKLAKNRKPYKSLMKKMKDAFEVDAECILDYCKQDVNLTHKLCEYFMLYLDDVDLNFYSDLIKCCVQSRANGVLVDESQIVNEEKSLLEIIKEKDSACFAMAGKEFNVNASDDFYDTIESIGIELPRTAKGNRSCTAKWMERQEHPIFDLIQESRNYHKLHNEFIVKIKDMMRNGKIYPSFRILAADTGRFTCSKPNIQQIPARVEESCGICRGIFIPPPGYKWCSIDFAGQEIRIQVHFAYLCELPLAAEIRQKYIDDPLLDLHIYVAVMMGFVKTLGEKGGKKIAKGLNLGLSYGMALMKLALALGLNLDESNALLHRLVVDHDVDHEFYQYVEDFRQLLIKRARGKIWHNDKLSKRQKENMSYEVRTSSVLKLLAEWGKAINIPTANEAVAYFYNRQYCESFPYLSELRERCMATIEERGYIITLGGRKLNVKKNKAYTKSLNSVIQGSAADQTMAAMVEFYRRGIPIMFPVHDEINYLIKEEKDAMIGKEIMENAVKLEVPVVAEVKIGRSWAECK